MKSFYVAVSDSPTMSLIGDTIGGVMQQCVDYTWYEHAYQIFECKLGSEFFTKFPSAIFYPSSGIDSDDFKWAKPMCSNCGAWGWLADECRCSHPVLEVEYFLWKEDTVEKAEEVVVPPEYDGDNVMFQKLGEKSSTTEEFAEAEEIITGQVFRCVRFSESDSLYPLTPITEYRLCVGLVENENKEDWCNISKFQVADVPRWHPCFGRLTSSSRRRRVPA